MIQLMIFFSGPVSLALIYLIVNLSSLWKKCREFQRMTELLVLEDQLERMIKAGQAVRPNDEALEQLGRNLMGNFRLDVRDQVQQVATRVAQKKKNTEGSK